MTLQHAKDLLEEGAFGFSPANHAKVRGSINKCAKLIQYGCTLDRIPCDPGLFVEKWAWHRKTKAIPDGFKTYKQFLTFYSNVKSVMDHATGARRERDELRGREDDWARLTKQAEALVRVGKAGVGVHQQDLIALTVLRALARENGCQPHALSAPIIEPWIDGIRPGQRTAVRRAIRLLDALRAHSDEIDPDLLSAPFTLPPAYCKRRQAAPLPAYIESHLTEYEASLLRPAPMQGLLKKVQRAARSKEHVKATMMALRWYFACLSELGHLPRAACPQAEDLSFSGSIAELLTIDLIEECFEGERCGAFSWDALAPRTLQGRLQMVFQFASIFDPDVALGRKQFFKRKYFEGLDGMTDENRAFCRKLVRSSQLSWKVMNFPRLFQEKAAPMIADWDNLSPSHRHIALDLSLGAAAASVLCFLPLRASSLTQIRVYGADPHVILSSEAGRRAHVDLVIPGDLIKNRKPVIGTFGRRGKTDPHAILTWWLLAPREKKSPRDLVMSRLESTDPDCLLGGASYGRLLKAWKYATADAGYYMNPHQARHAIASLLINEPHVDTAAVASVLNISPATLLRVYAFFDVEKAVARGQHGLSEINTALEKGLRT